MKCRSFSKQFQKQVFHCVPWARPWRLFVLHPGLQTECLARVPRIFNHNASGVLHYLQNSPFFRAQGGDRVDSGVEPFCCDWRYCSAGLPTSTNSDYIIFRLVIYTSKQFVLYLFVQSTEFEPCYLSTRIVFILILFSSVVLFQNFAASYTSFLSVINQEENVLFFVILKKTFQIKPFETISQLYSDTGYIAGTLEGTVGGQIFKVLVLSGFLMSISCSQTVYGSVGEKMYKERWQDVADSDAAMALMKSSQYAYMGATQTMLRELSMNSICHIDIKHFAFQKRLVTCVM